MYLLDGSTQVVWPREVLVGYGLLQKPEWISCIFSHFQWKFSSSPMTLIRITNYNSDVLCGANKKYERKKFPIFHLLVFVLLFIIISQEWKIICRRSSPNKTKKNKQKPSANNSLLSVQSDKDPQLHVLDKFLSLCGRWVTFNCRLLPSYTLCLPLCLSMFVFLSLAQHVSPFNSWSHKFSFTYVWVNLN